MFLTVPTSVLLAFSVSAVSTASLSADIDRLIAVGHPGYATQAAPLASDAEFIRRVYLDLHGTIPSADAVRAYLADASPTKRVRLVGELVQHPAFARRMMQFFDVTLMERRNDSKVSRADWEKFLRTSFAENKPYNKLIQEILAADGSDPKNRGPAKFYLDRDFEPNLVTRDIARLLLGQDLTCAQCHNHPVVEDYKQADYFGIYAFLNRSSLFPNVRDAKAVLAEKADGEVTFESVFDTSQKQHGTAPHLPDGQLIVDPPLVKGKEYTVPPGKKAASVPTYSRRAQLAKVLPTPENPQFARNAVNRLWAMLMGRGLVHPLDLDHPRNPPSHPELLDRLTTTFVEHDYDVKWLIQQIASSDTYARSSATTANDLPEDRYLVAMLKPLTPEQFAYAVLQASGRTDLERTALGKKLTEEALDARLASQASALRRAFTGPPGEAEREFLVTLDQTLFVKHGPAIRSLLAPAGQNLIGRLTAEKDPQKIADALFLGILSRPATEEERQIVVETFKSTPDQKTVLAELAWSLIASAEFRFNH
ncbi:MAG: DUF1549 and DUF1553 domain-containing protein [Bacteroidales bacterium]|nr:DUF1549 and DUF1553 domain-containing protein [Bacteroidales bacterium]